MIETVKKIISNYTGLHTNSISHFEEKGHHFFTFKGKIDSHKMIKLNDYLLDVFGDTEIAMGINHKGEYQIEIEKLPNVINNPSKKKRKSFSSKLVVGKKYKFVGDTSKGDFKDIETFRVVNKKKAKDYQSGWKRGDTIYKILFDDDSVADWYSQQELGSFKLIKNNPIGGSMVNKKLLMYAALAVGGWYAWAWWQKKKLGAGVQSALTQGSTTAQQMVSFI